jgi:CheY-like chemotaxis protein
MAAQRKSHILVVDDDPKVLKLFSRILNKGGYAVTETNRSSQAVRILGEKPVDLMVLDLDMPEPDGFDVLKALKRERPGLRILVVSGYMQGGLLRASELLGATAALAKADAPKSLLKTVGQILR